MSILTKETNALYNGLQTKVEYSAALYNRLQAKVEYSAVVGRKQLLQKLNPSYNTNSCLGPENMCHYSVD